MSQRLPLENLEVETFDPNATPEPVIGEPTYIVWTGCDSACTECGTGGVNNQFPGV